MTVGGRVREPVPGLRPVSDVIAFLLGQAPRRRTYWAASRWANTVTRDSATQRAGLPWVLRDYEVLVAWLRKQAYPEDVGRSRVAFIGHLRFLLDDPPTGEQELLEACRQAVADPAYEYPLALQELLTNPEPLRDTFAWEDGELHWTLRAVHDHAGIDFLSSTLQRTEQTINDQLRPLLPALLAPADDADVVGCLRLYMHALAAPRQYRHPQPTTGPDQQVPRRPTGYTRPQRESLALLHATGWTDPDIGRLLGEPDGVSPHTDPGYGTDRVLLATLTDPELRDHLIATERPHALLQQLHDAQTTTPDQPTGIWIDLPGFGWLVLTPAGTTPDQVVTVHRHGTTSRAILTAPVTFGDHTLSAARRAPEPHTP